MSAQKTRPRGVFTAIIGLVGFSALAGLLVTVMVAPALAVTSVTASSTISIFDNLPEAIEIGSQPQQNQIFAIKGTKDDGTPKYVKIATVYGNQNREELSWEQIPQVVKDATLAAEDKRFYEHGGIDPQGIIRAAVKNATTGSQEGASTLTQQLVKNLCVVEALTKYSTAAEDPLFQAAADSCKEGTLDRKIKEMKYAIGLEKAYSKDDILLAYLNIAAFGGTVYGIQSAAQRYYNVNAADLTPAQAASLIAIVQEPEQRRLDYPDNYVNNQDRRDHILATMLDSGTLDQAGYDAAIATPVSADTVDVQDSKNGCLAAQSTAKQFCDYVVENVKNLTSLGADEKERLANWKLGGYKLYTTLDLKLQKVAQASVRKWAPADETRLDLGASAISIEPGTGKIRTMAQNKKFDNRSEENGGGGLTTSALNFNTDRDYGGSSGFQPGSSYKIFTLLNWLEAGHGLNERVDVTKTSTPQSEFTDTCNGPWSGAPFSPRNDSGETGYYTIREATANSVNGGYVQMALQLDLCRTKEIAVALGVHLSAPRQDDPDTPDVDETQDPTDLSTNPASILGTNSVAPISIAGAFAGVANNGVYCKPVAVERITDKTGAELAGQSADCTEAIDSEVAIAAQSALQTGGGRYQGNPQDGTPLMGKTGTTDSSRDTWITLSSTALTTTIWVGNITGKYPMRSYYANGQQGGTLRHLIVRDIMAAADKTYKGKAFDEPSSRLINGINVPVGDYVGMTEADAKAAIEAAKLTYSNQGEIASSEPKGTVAKQTPGAGLSISQGQTVKVWISDGSKGVVPDVVGQSADAATSQINGLGFASVAQTCVVTPIGGGAVDPATGQPDPSVPNVAEGQVVSVKPSAGTVLTLSKTVTLGVAHAAC